MASDSSSTLVSSVSVSVGSSGISTGRVLLQQTPNTCDNKTGIGELFSWILVYKLWTGHIRNDHNGLNVIPIFNLIYNNPTGPHLPPLRGLVAAGVIEPHHPGLAGAEVVNFEVGIAALETHALARPAMINSDWRSWTVVSGQWSDSRSIFTLAGSSQGRNQERWQHIVQPRVLPGLARDLTWQETEL